MSAEGGSTDSGDCAAAVFYDCTASDRAFDGVSDRAVLLLAGMMFLRWAQSWQ